MWQKIIACLYKWPFPGCVAVFHHPHRKARHVPSHYIQLYGAGVGRREVTAHPESLISLYP